MILRTKRLVLTDRSTKEDIPSLLKAINDKEIWYFTSSIPYPYTRKDALKYLKKANEALKKKPRTGYNFYLKFKGKKEIIGAIGLHGVNREHKKCTIGYWLDKRHRKQGLISEAEKVVLDFAFKKLKLNKVSGEAITENKGSNALFKKFGFRKIGIGKEELIKKGKKKDVYIWELLKRNYKK